MYWLANAGLSSALSATCLAVLVFFVCRVARRPALSHALWVLVLIKLVAPPLIPVPVQIPRAESSSFPFGRQVSEAGGNGFPQTVFSDSASAIELTGIAIQTALFDASIVARPSLSPTDDGKAWNVSSGQEAHENQAPLALAAALARQPVSSWGHSLRWSWECAYSLVAALGTFRDQLILAVLLAWLIGSAAFFVSQWWLVLRFRQFILCSSYGSGILQQRADRLAKQMGLRDCPTVLLVRGVIAPMLWGFGPRAKLLFPEELVETINTQSQCTLLAHELAHYRRGDHWVRVLELLAMGLFWWHPVVWWARREIEIAEEQCCDAWVVAQFPKTPRQYAEALLDTVDFVSNSLPMLSPISSGIGDAPLLRKRLTMIMHGVAPKSLSSRARVATLMLAGVVLPPCPTLLRTPKTDAEVQVLDVSETTDHVYAKAATVAASKPATSPQARVALLRSLTTEPLIAGAWATAVSSNERYLVAASSGYRVRMIDGSLGRETDLGVGRVACAAFSPDNRVLAVGCLDGAIELRDCQTGAISQHLHVDKAIHSVDFSRDGRLLAAGGIGGEVRLYDVRAKSWKPFSIPSAGAVRCVRFSEDGEFLAVATRPSRGSGIGRVELWSLPDQQHVASIASTSAVAAVAFAADMASLVVANWNGECTNWSWTSSAASPCGDVKREVVAAACFSRDCRDAHDAILASVSATD